MIVSIIYSIWLLWRTNNSLRKFRNYVKSQHPDFFYHYFNYYLFNPYHRNPEPIKRYPDILERLKTFKNETFLMIAGLFILCLLYFWAG